MYGGHKSLPQVNGIKTVFLPILRKLTQMLITIDRLQKLLGRNLIGIVDTILL